MSQNSCLIFMPADLVQLTVDVDVQGHRLQAPGEVGHVVQVLIHVHVRSARNLTWAR